MDDKFYLGKLCRREHRHRDTNATLRTVNSGHCVICKRKWHEDRRDDRVYPPKQTQEDVYKKIVSKIGDTYFLGKICGLNHDWGKTGKSLRSKKGGKYCIVCSMKNRRISGSMMLRLSYLKLYFTTKRNVEKKKE